MALTGGKRPDLPDKTSVEIDAQDYFQKWFDDFRQTTCEKANMYIFNKNLVKDLSEETRLYIQSQFEECHYFQTVTTDDVVCFENIASMSGVESSTEEYTSSGEYLNAGSDVQATSNLLSPSPLDETSGSFTVLDQARTSEELFLNSDSPCRKRCNVIKLHGTESNPLGLYRTRLNFRELFEWSQTGVFGALSPNKRLSLTSSVMFSCYEEEGKLCIKVLFLRADIIKGDLDRIIKSMRISFTASLGSEPFHLQHVPKTEDMVLRTVAKGKAVETFYSCQKRQGMKLQATPTVGMNTSLGHLTLTGSEDMHVLRSRDETLTLLTLERGYIHVGKDLDLPCTIELIRHHANCWFCNREIAVEFSDEESPILLMGRVPEGIDFNSKNLVISCSVEIDVLQIMTVRSPTTVIAEDKRTPRTLAYSNCYKWRGE